jgi:hypothetical protein
MRRSHQGARLLARQALDLAVQLNVEPYCPESFAMRDTWAVILASFSGFFC